MFIYYKHIKYIYMFLYICIRYSWSPMLYWFQEVSIKPRLTLTESLRCGQAESRKEVRRKAFWNCDTVCARLLLSKKTLSMNSAYLLFATHGICLCALYISVHTLPYRTGCTNRALGGCLRNFQGFCQNECLSFLLTSVSSPSVVQNSRTVYTSCKDEGSPLGLF